MPRRAKKHLENTKLIFHRNFEKQIRKLKSGERGRLKERLKIFLDDPFDPRLGNHPLRGKYSDYRSINIGGGLRAIYKNSDNEEYIFSQIGTHSELYS